MGRGVRGGDCPPMVRAIFDSFRAYCPNSARTARIRKESNRKFRITFSIHVLQLKIFPARFARTDIFSTVGYATGVFDSDGPCTRLPQILHLKMASGES